MADLVGISFSIRAISSSCYITDAQIPSHGKTTAGRLVQQVGQTAGRLVQQVGQTHFHHDDTGLTLTS